MAEAMIKLHSQEPGELGRSISLLRHQLCDVTLACEDGEPLAAHRLVLAAGSDRLAALLARAPPAQQLCLLLPGLTSNQGAAVLELLYCGEVRLQEEEVQDFLQVATSLQIRGLQLATTAHQVKIETGQQEEVVEVTNTPVPVKNGKTKSDNSTQTTCNGKPHCVTQKKKREVKPSEVPDAWLSSRGEVTLNRFQKK